jgi:hypothetical protein
MTRQDAISRIEDACKQIALQMMKLQPAARALGDEATQAAVVKAAHQLTVELEVIKKHIIRLQQRDDSTEL